MRMPMNLKRSVCVVALTLGLGMAAGTVQLMASPSPQDVHVDYSKNKNYQLGMQDGRVDYAHKRDHFKKRNFKKDDDRKDYETGYQAGHHEPDHK
jgi:hypothetical protein